MPDLQAIYVKASWEAFQDHRIEGDRGGLYSYLPLVRRHHVKMA